VDDLIATVSQKTGIDADKAKTAVETVVNFLKEKLPGPVGGQIEQALSGSGSDIAGGISKGLGGLFGK
jgi:hypothetical protein